MRSGSKRSLRLASICSDEVMKGGWGRWVRGVEVIDSTRHVVAVELHGRSSEPRGSLEYFDACAFASSAPARVEVLAGGERGPVHAIERSPRRRSRPRSAVAVTSNQVAEAKGHALALALTDQSDRDRLHAAGRAGLVDGAPEHRRDLVAHQSVEESATLLGVDQSQVEVAGLARRPW